MKFPITNNVLDIEITPKADASSGAFVWNLEVGIWNFSNRFHLSLSKSYRFHFHLFLISMINWFEFLYQDDFLI